MRIILILLLCASIARGEDVLLRFKSDYPAAAERLESAYAHTRITARQIADRKGKEVVEEAEYLRSGDAIRRTLTKEDEVEVRGGNARTYFVLARQPSGEFRINSYAANPNFEQSSRLLYVPLFAPYCFYGNRVVDYLALPTVKLTAASKSKLDDENVVEVVMQTSTPKGTTVQRLWFLPDSWALAGFQLGLTGAAPPKSSSLEGRARYETGEPPKLKSIETWFNDDGLKKQYKRYEITTFEFVEIPQSEFSVTAFGLDEPETLREGSSYLLFLLIAIAVLLVLGVVFRKVAR